MVVSEKKILLRQEMIPIHQKVDIARSYRHCKALVFCNGFYFTIITDSISLQYVIASMLLLVAARKNN